ncbi:MAG: sarcosine oxidase subunit gamma family protein [Caulobacteraceae bacterium]|nr:sarcosine oxidase subunit gamma family protein [Caulobacteraceae bacterium]
MDKTLAPNAARGALDGFTAAPALGLAAACPMTRFVLRGRAEALAAAEAELGFLLPRQACRAASLDGRHALWLGPDEWLILAPLADGPALGEALEAAMGAHPHSLVEISQRQTAIVISGPRATGLLNVGCPLDLDLAAFPVGMCTRTVFAKAEIGLWRRAPDSFHIEVWRSFSPYVWRFLEAAGAEYA